MRSKNECIAEFERWKGNTRGWMLEDLNQMEHLPEGEFEKQLIERFSIDADFGTGGLRSIIRTGTNGMNDVWVERISRAIAQTADSVVIAYDTRNFSESFAKLAADTIAQMGKTAWLFPAPTPTPVLSFAVRYLQCDAGIVITASHNPPAYNGYKVYDGRGVQLIPSLVDELKERMESIPFFPPMENRKKKKGSSAYKMVPDQLAKAYEEQVIEQLSPWIKPEDEPIPVVYTPLHGTGALWIPKIMPRIGIIPLTIEEQMNPDPEFSTVSLPNPEDPDAFAHSISFAERQDPRPQAILATDPDTDRMGIQVWNGAQYQPLNGNEIGILLLDFLIQKSLVQGRDLRNSVVLKTIVSTEMVNRMKTRYGFQLIETLTGFKYLGDQIEQLEEPDQEFLFAFEESYGYLYGDQSRDKDAIMGCLLFCLLVKHFGSGEHILQNLEVLRGEYGYYREGLITQEFPGVEGLQQMQAFMRRIREKPPITWAQQPLTESRDYAQESGIMKGDVLEWRFGKKLKIIIRPSGTEPKLKAYFFCRENTQNETNQLLASSIEAWNHFFKP